MPFRMFGGLAAVVDGRELELGGRKQRTVLAALLVHRRRTVSPGQLIEHVWGEVPPPSAESTLQAYISNLRRVLEIGRQPRQAPRTLLSRAGGYFLDVDDAAVDVGVFEELGRRGHDALRAGELSAAAELLDSALAQWTGEPLPEFAGEPWAEAMAVRLTQVRGQVLEDRFEVGLARAEHERLLPAIIAAISAAPFHERLRGQLALALYRSGRQREALAAVQAAREVLLEEAGLELGPDLRRLESQMLQQSPALDLPVDAPAARPVAPAAPAPHEQASSPSRDHRSTGPFVGRVAELRSLLAAHDSAGTGQGRPVVVSGEPGIGKTRLVEELVAMVPDTVVAWARCPESAAQEAYGPWLEIANQLDGLDVLDGELRALFETSRESVVDDVTAGRLALHRGVSALIRSARRPLLLVLDDLQWADPASLRTLEFIAGELITTSVLVVVTTRPTAGDADRSLVECLGELARASGAVRLQLRGLQAGEISEWIEARGDAPSDPAVAGLVHDRTAGNPFFVGELLELLAADGALTDITTTRRRWMVPAAVNDVVRHRVGRLPGDSQQLLTTASVVGRRFDIDVLAAVSDVSPLDVLDRLDAALNAGLVEETEVPGRLQFAHALVAETLIAEIRPARRARIHAATAIALARLRAGSLDSHLAELAHHAVAGMVAGTADVAVEWSMRAARALSHGTAYEEAAAHWTRALRALELARPEDRATRLTILTELGRVHIAADSIVDGYTVLIAAIDAAVEIGDLDALVDAVSSMNVDRLWVTLEMGAQLPDAEPALQRALDALPAGPSAARALALGAMAESSYWTRSPAEIERLTREAVAVARVIGDRALLVRLLHKRVQTLWFPSTLAERHAAAHEATTLIVGTGAPAELEALALFGRAAVAWEQGDVLACERDVGHASRLAERLGAPALIAQVQFFQAAIDVWYGRLAHADELIDLADDLYRRTRGSSPEAFGIGYKLMVWMERGRLDLVHQAMPTFLGASHASLSAEIVAAVLSLLGDAEGAAAVAPSAVPEIPESWMYLGVYGCAAHVRVAAGDVDGARRCGERLRPFAGRLASFGTGPAFGDVAYALARVEDLLGDDDEARRLANVSVDVCRRAGGGPWLARSLMFRSRLTGSVADSAEAAAIVAAGDLPLLRSQLA